MTEKKLEARTLWDPASDRTYVVHVAPGMPPLPFQKDAPPVPPLYGFALSQDAEDGYTGPYASIDEALKAACEYLTEVGASDGKHGVHVARLLPVEPDRWAGTWADDLIEHLGEMAYEESGEVGAGWLSDIAAAEMDELRRLLGEAFLSWIHRFPHHRPTFHRIDPFASITKHNVTVGEPET